MSVRLYWIREEFDTRGRPIDEIFSLHRLRTDTQYHNKVHGAWIDYRLECNSFIVKWIKDGWYLTVNDKVSSTRGWLTLVHE